MGGGGGGAAGVAWRTGGAASGFLIQHQCHGSRGEARASAGMSDELLKGFAIITFWKRWAPGSLLPREGAVFTHTEVAALGAGLGCCGVAGALFLPRAFMTQTCGICGGFWVIFLCGDTVFPFNLFRGRDSLQPGI